MRRLTEKEIKGIMKMLEKGKTYQAVANRYGLTNNRVYKVAMSQGKSRRWRLNAIQERNERLRVEITKELCVLPNAREICRQKGISYFGLMAGRDGFRAKKIKCYNKARNTCSICGKDITERAWDRRLCDEHKISETNRQQRVRIEKKKVGDKSKTVKRVHKFVIPNPPSVPEDDGGIKDKSL